MDRYLLENLENVPYLPLASFSEKVSLVFPDNIPPFKTQTKYLNINNPTDHLITATFTSKIPPNFNINWVILNKVDKSFDQKLVSSKISLKPNGSVFLKVSWSNKVPESKKTYFSESFSISFENTRVEFQVTGRLLKPITSKFLPAKSKFQSNDAQIARWINSLLDYSHHFEGHTLFTDESKGFLRGTETLEFIHKVWKALIAYMNPPKGICLKTILSRLYEFINSIINPYWTNLFLDIIIECHSNSPDVALVKDRYYGFLNHPQTLFIDPKTKYDKNPEILMISRTFIFILLVDKLKIKFDNSKVPLLFKTSSKFKSTIQVLSAFRERFLTTNVDSAKIINFFKNSTLYTQTELEEKQLHLSNLHENIRDGIILLKITEILESGRKIKIPSINKTVDIGHNVLTKLARYPPVSRLQKIFNLNIAIGIFKETVFTDKDGPKIDANMIVDKLSKDKVSCYLWMLLLHYQINPLCKSKVIHCEILTILNENGENDLSNVPEEEKTHELLHYWACILFGRLFDTEDDSIMDNSSAIVICSLIHHYIPTLMPFKVVENFWESLKNSDGKLKEINRKLIMYHLCLKISPIFSGPNQFILDSYKNHNSIDFQVLAVLFNKFVPLDKKTMEISRPLMEKNRRSAAAVVIQSAWRRRLNLRESLLNTTRFTSYNNQSQVIEKSQNVDLSMNETTDPDVSSATMEKPFQRNLNRKSFHFATKVTFSPIFEKRQLSDSQTHIPVSVGKKSLKRTSNTCNIADSDNVNSQSPFSSSNNLLTANSSYLKTIPIPNSSFEEKDSLFEISERPGSIEQEAKFHHPKISLNASEIMVDSLVIQPAKDEEIESGINLNSTTFDTDSAQSQRKNLTPKKTFNLHRLRNTHVNSPLAMENLSLTECSQKTQVKNNRASVSFSIDMAHPSCNKTGLSGFLQENPNECSMDQSVMVNPPTPMNEVSFTPSPNPSFIFEPKTPNEKGNSFIFNQNIEHSHVQNSILNLDEFCPSQISSPARNNSNLTIEQKKHDSPKDKTSPENHVCENISKSQKSYCEESAEKDNQDTPTIASPLKKSFQDTNSATVDIFQTDVQNSKNYEKPIELKSGPHKALEEAQGPDWEMAKKLEVNESSLNLDQTENLFSHHGNMEQNYSGSIESCSSNASEKSEKTDLLIKSNRNEVTGNQSLLDTSLPCLSKLVIDENQAHNFKKSLVELKTANFENSHIQANLGCTASTTKETDNPDQIFQLTTDCCNKDKIYQINHCSLVSCNDKIKEQNELVPDVPLQNWEIENFDLSVLIGLQSYIRKRISRLFQDYYRFKLYKTDIDEKCRCESCSKMLEKLENDRKD